MKDEHVVALIAGRILFSGQATPVLSDADLNAAVALAARVLASAKKPI